MNSVSAFYFLQQGEQKRVPRACVGVAPRGGGGRLSCQLRLSGVTDLVVHVVQLPLQLISLVRCRGEDSSFTSHRLLQVNYTNSLLSTTPSRVLKLGVIPCVAGVPPSPAI